MSVVFIFMGLTALCRWLKLLIILLKLHIEEHRFSCRQIQVITLEYI